MFSARVRAVLGPTNTGKTHLAITRLLAHASGIIGFPLRLLARENYDRMVAAKGEKHVALITGEEKIIPPEAKWFACTVEAMPLDRRTEFVAVDEIQLCADSDRGHIFTDRLLYARGLVETMFLGAETIRPLLQRLVPQAEIETRPRLSQLTHAGQQKLTRLPPRSAIVAFSATEVYAIAEAVRRRRGGCAVVMGRLSPRTRNAQVALYQNREVDFLVATDAIGMGLNMDVDHVAFASLRKFDGHAVRDLTAQEAAQIAGRAGRGMRDGSFGATADCPAIPDEMARQIENHAFEPLQQLAWRNSDLDFATVDALLESLAAPPPQQGLAKGNDAVDHITLHALSREGDVRDLAQGRAAVRLLWEACQVPDFRKIADDSHTRLCGRIFGHLAKEGRLPAEWVAGSIAGLDNTEGDLDTLMARLANIRIWAYIAARADWLADAPSHQNEARRAEDRVSDALHERLLARFVDRRAAHLIRSLDDQEKELLSAVTRQGEVVVEGHAVGRVIGFHFEPDPAATEAEEKRLVLRAARRALREEMPRRLASLEMARDEHFSLTPQHRVLWDGAEVARLRPGPEPLKPMVDAVNTEFLDGAQRDRVRNKVALWLEKLVRKELGALAAVEAKAAEDNTLRGPAFRLREGMGIVPGGTERDIPPALRAKLKAIGIRAGRYALYIPDMLKPRAMALRAQFWAIRHHLPTPALPGSGPVSITLPAVPQPPPADPQAPRPPESWPPGFAPFAGWLQAENVLLRLDVVERVAGELGALTRRGAAPLPDVVASRLGLKAEALAPVLEAMGFRLLPAEPVAEGQFGPPIPARIAPLRHERRPPRLERPPSPTPDRWDPAVMFGPPVPRALRHPRPSRPPPPADRWDAAVMFGPPAPRPPRHPRPDRPPRRDAPRHAVPQPPAEAAPAATQAERSRFERPRPPAANGDAPPRRDDRGPRPDRPRFDGPRRDRDRDQDRAPREYQSGPKPDSPFAILAQLRLKKD